MRAYGIRGLGMPLDGQFRIRAYRLWLKLSVLTLASLALVLGASGVARAEKFVLEDWDGPAPVGNWKTNGQLDFKGWESFVSDPTSLSTSRAATSWEGRGLYGHSGLSILGGQGTAEWRWKTPGTSTIFKAEYAPATFSLLGCLNEGFRKADGSWQASTNARPGETQQSSYHPTACGAGVLVPPLANAQVIIGNPGRQVFCSNTSDSCSRLESPIGNSAVFGIQRIGLVQPWFSAYLLGARLYLTDYDRPTITGATNSLTGWVKDGVGAIKATATDTGLGVKKIRLSSPNRTGGREQQTEVHPCTGDRNDRCPASWNSERPAYSPTFSYDVDDLPEGINRFGLKAFDIVENESLPDGEDDLQTVPVTKVDRSAPENVTASGELFDIGDPNLLDPYINGQGTNTVTASAHDPAAADGQRLSGIKRFEVEDVGHGTIAQADVACEADQCPVDASADLTVDTGQLGEGAHKLRVVAVDLAGNRGESATWDVYVDRTGPRPAENVRLIMFDPSLDDSAVIGWDLAEDPDLPDGTPGSGAGPARVRYRINNGAFSAWQDVDGPSVDVEGVQVGDTVALEIISIDRVGNESTVGTGTATVKAQLEDPEVQDMAAIDFVERFGGTHQAAVQWLDAQDRSDGLAEDVADSPARSGYGGVWYDNEAKTINVGLTPGTPRAPVEAIFQARNVTSEARIVEVQYDQDQLEQAQPGIQDQLQDLIDAGLLEIARNPQLNAITIDIAQPATAAQRTRVQQVADAAPVRVVVRNSDMETFTLEDLAGRACRFFNKGQVPDGYPGSYHTEFGGLGCQAPLRGAMRIFHKGNNAGEKPTLCTVGFQAKVRSGDNAGKPVSITAGHCIADSPGQIFWWGMGKQGGFGPIGQESNKLLNDKRGDYGMTYIQRPTWVNRVVNRVFVGGGKHTTRNEWYPIRRVTYNAKGRFVCLSGSTNGTKCGDIEDVGVTGNGHDFQAKINLCMGGGDSGGPVIKGGSAKGVISARDTRIGPGGCHTYFQGAAGAQTALDVSILTK